MIMQELHDLDKEIDKVVAETASIRTAIVVGYVALSLLLPMIVMMIVLTVKTFFALPTYDNMDVIFGTIESRLLLRNVMAVMTGAMMGVCLLLLALSMLSMIVSCSIQRKKNLLTMALWEKIKNENNRLCPKCGHTLFIMSSEIS
jgi:hypothetical protein